MISIKLDTKKLDKSLRDIANAIRRQIRENCAAQLDMHDSQFDAYSPAYVIAKAKYQSKTKNLNIARASKVNMMRTGLMLRSIKVAKRGTGASLQYEIYFDDKSRAIIAYYHHMGKGQPKREFFGVSDKNAKAIYNTYLPKEVLTK